MSPGAVTSTAIGPAAAKISTQQPLRRPAVTGWGTTGSHKARAILVPVPRGLGNADRDLYSGLIRLHILHHAAEEPIFGLGMAEELARHGYTISPGTLYPLLRGLEKKGYLRSWEKRYGKSGRIMFRATPAGLRALKAAKQKVRELFGELSKAHKCFSKPVHTDSAALTLVA